VANKKIQVPAVGGIRKVIQPAAASSATTIAGLEGQTLSVAQLKALLGNVQASGPSTPSAAAAATASLVVGPGLIGGGPIVGAVPLRLVQLTPPVVWNDTLLPDDWIIVGGSGGGGSSGSSTLAGLSDVTITSPTTGQVLAYNGTKWSNQTVAGVTNIVNKGASWVSTSGAITAAAANVVFVSCPIAGTILGVTVLTSGGPGSCVLDVWKAPFASFPPTSANSIAASDKPTISSGTTYSDTTLTGWTTAISAGDVLAFKVVSVATFTQIEVVLQVSQ
jgi:hypothetical protein